ncbi:MAG: sulfite exporter TauE/SafE family protein [Alphaproteobacteria bacterium]|nr:sulfite exporter TauE/SafE family protein [Alphaproteobacteria bacterium]MBL6937953.1 sulfite exporter TauE/SafE family protein [Alphaproteobacteria bacterium]MBL7099222.1 sulfite exporter TauE/SafE family protein [Alphaproteobacteria bacterium]
MIVDILLAALAVVGVGYTGMLLRYAAARAQVGVTVESIGLGAVTNFFDTLGIGSFAPTTAWLKLRSLVPDRFIPATLNAGHCIPTIVQALVFIRLVRVDPWLLLACIVAAMAGSFVGTAAVLRVHVRIVQGTVGVALMIAAVLYAMQNLNLMPNNGNALTLVPMFFVLAVLAHFILGSLMAFGIGLYAPSLVTLSLMGLDPKAAFPIMMGACAFLMPVTGLRFAKDPRVDLRIILGLALGGAPAVLLAAYAVTSLPLVALRWGVVAVVLYAAFLLLRAAARPEPAPETEASVTA